MFTLFIYAELMLLKSWTCFGNTRSPPGAVSYEFIFVFYIYTYTVACRHVAGNDQ
jgi:hypothetical protein